MKKVISRIGVLQAGKIFGMLYVGFAVIMLPFFILGALASPQGFIPMIIMLVLYPLIGFVGGVVAAFVYNLSAKFVGGLEFKIDTIEE